MYPIIAVVYYSFTDYDIVTPPVFTGLDNYQRLIEDDTFWLALTHSFVYLLVTPILIVLSIALAIVVNRRLRGIHLYRALYFVPAVSGSIAIGLSWRWLFDRTGFINSVLLSWGVIDEPVQWLTTPSLVLPIAMMLTIWAGIGYYAVIFLAGLQNVHEELYDAARIDGCTDFQKHRYVSIPALRPQIVFVAVISSLAALKVFDEIYVLTNRTGGILDSGVTMVFYLWQQAFQLQQRGLRVGDRDRAAGRDAGLLDRQRPAARARGPGRGMSDVRVPLSGPLASSLTADEAAEGAARRRARRRGGWLRDGGWYVVLSALAVITVFPFVWMLLTSLKGPADVITSVPPQFLPNDPTLANYVKVLGQPADRELLPQQRHRRHRDGAAERAGRGAGRVPAGEDALPRPGGDLLRAARDADRAGPADLHPELHPRGQRLPATTTRCRR